MMSNLIYILYEIHVSGKKSSDEFIIYPGSLCSHQGCKDFYKYVVILHFCYEGDTQVSLYNLKLFLRIRQTSASPPPHTFSLYFPTLFFCGLLL